MSGGRSGWRFSSDRREKDPAQHPCCAGSSFLQSVGALARNASVPGQALGGHPQARGAAPAKDHAPLGARQAQYARSISWTCWYSQSFTGTEMPCLAARRRMVPANSSTSLFRWFLPSCRMEGSPSGGR